MRVEDLMNMLSNLSPDAIVYAFDPDTDAIEPITGCVYNQDSVELCTDVDEHVVWVMKSEHWLRL